MTKLIHLRNETWSVTIAPEKGACITACECNDVPVLEPAVLSRIEAGGVFNSSCFPLVPYSNRIKDGVFHFAGRDYTIEPNHPGNIFPIHGNGWEQAWQVESVSAAQCILTLNYKPKAGGWPWQYRAKQTFTLDGQTITISLLIENADSAPAPAGLGFHPSFARAASAQAKFNTRAMWACDALLLPTERMAITAETDFSAMRAVKGARFDNCFEGWDGSTEICWDDFEGAIHMQASPALSNLVVYIDSKNDYFCLEPVSHINNALNMGEGMTVLQPGETLSGSVKLSFMPQRR